jgi:hypothetical protein
MPLPDARTLDVFGVTGFPGVDAKAAVDSYSLDIPSPRSGVFVGGFTADGIELGFIASGEQIYSVGVQQAVSLSLVSSEEQVFSVAASQSISLGSVASGEQLFAPSIVQVVSLGMVATEEQLFSVSSSISLSLSFIAGEDEVFGLAVLPEQLLTLSFIETEEGLYSFRIKGTFVPPRPTVPKTITVDLPLDNLSRGVDPALDTLSVPNEMAFDNLTSARELEFDRLT